MAAQRPRNAAMVMPDQGISVPTRPPKLQKIAASKMQMGPLICCFTLVIITEKIRLKRVTFDDESYKKD
jgi:hypothetical protein